jgi:hypothetical protein
MSSAAPPGAIATWTPPSRLSLVILAVESDGSLTSGSRLSLVTARKVLGSRLICETVPTLTPATLTAAPGASEPTWPNLAVTS